MRKQIFSYFEIAARTALSKDDERSFILGAVGVRKDGTVVKSLNSPTALPNYRLHSEFKLCSKLDYGATVYVARVRLDNFELGMSKPCKTCMKAMISKKVKKIYYSIDRNSYGVINL